MSLTVCIIQILLCLWRFISSEYLSITIHNGTCLIAQSERHSNAAKNFPLNLILLNRFTLFAETHLAVVEAVKMLYFEPLFAI